MKKHSHDTIQFKAFIATERCKFCRRSKYLGECEDGCKMCQSCYHKENGLCELPSEKMYEWCHCGEKLHYSNPDDEADMKRIIAKRGEFITVTVNGRSWKVPRHYIALHGLKGYELPALGFEEIK